MTVVVGGNILRMSSHGVVCLFFVADMQHLSHALVQLARCFFNFFSEGMLSECLDRVLSTKLLVSGGCNVLSLEG